MDIRCRSKEILEISSIRNITFFIQPSRSQMRIYLGCTLIQRGRSKLTIYMDTTLATFFNSIKNDTIISQVDANELKKFRMIGNLFCDLSAPTNFHMRDGHTFEFLDALNTIEKQAKL